MWRHEHRLIPSAALLVSIATDGSLIGAWGGEHIAVVVSESGARIELDCGQGRIDEPLRLTADRTFEAHGTYLPDRGGPAELGKPSTQRALTAVYKGSIDGGRMRLTILVPETGRKVGTFSLCSGCQPRLDKCL